MRVPVEISNKHYIWTCTLEISFDKWISIFWLTVLRWKCLDCQLHYVHKSSNHTFEKFSYMYPNKKGKKTSEDKNSFKDDINIIILLQYKYKLVTCNVTLILVFYYYASPCSLPDAMISMTLHQSCCFLSNLLLPWSPQMSFHFHGWNLWVQCMEETNRSSA